MTPYAIILVDDNHVKRRLADACIGGNSRRVLEAPLTAVFAADLQAADRIDAVVAMERRAGKPSQYLRSLEFNATVVAPSGPQAFGHAVQCAKSAALQAAGALAPMPSVNSAEGWAFKNTMLAAQSFMLAASAHGLSTHPMEGFDAGRIRAACSIPPRYGVPVIICAGYAATHAPHPSPRPRIDAIFYNNQFSVTASPS